MANYNKLSAREKREAEKLYLKGKTIKQVAEAISRSYTGVRNHLKKKKFTRKEVKGEMAESRTQKVDSLILSVLKDTKGLGITPKQISGRIDVEEERIKSSLRILREKGEALSIGRRLWIHKDYEKLENISDFIGSKDYLKKFKRKFGILLQEDFQKINFNSNINESVHRWTPYIQGFSSKFVTKTLERYGITKESNVLDPMAGSGTVLVEAKKRGMKNIGVEMLPLMAFISRVKTTWDIDTDDVQDKFENLDLDKTVSKDEAPSFLQTEKQFKVGVLKNLLKLKKAILDVDNTKIQNLFKLAFAGILIDSSNLKRSPCLGYVENKEMPEEAPFTYFEQKVSNIIEDLKSIQSLKGWGKSEVIMGDSKEVEYDPQSIDIAITSPPYMNGLDYVINYKLEMAWLDFVSEYSELSELKDKMIVCDNVSRRVTKYFSKKLEKGRAYSEDWLAEIAERLSRKMELKESYRRIDMPIIVRKYFDDLFSIFEKVYKGLKRKGRFVIVIGDSVIATVYIPTDLLLAKMGEMVGFEVEEIRVARKRRSGQRTGFELRESIVSLRKG